MNLRIGESQQQTKKKNKMNKTVLNKLQNNKGRFVSISVKRAKTGITTYSGQVRGLTNSTLTFADSNANGRIVRVPLKNVVG